MNFTSPFNVGETEIEKDIEEMCLCSQTVPFCGKVLDPGLFLR
jgi:hypothetical protein